MIELKAMM